MSPFTDPYISKIRVSSTVESIAFTVNVDPDTEPPTIATPPKTSEKNCRLTERAKSDAKVFAWKASADSTAPFVDLVAATAKSVMLNTPVTILPLMDAWPNCAEDETVLFVSAAKFDTPP